MGRLDLILPVLWWLCLWLKGTESVSCGSGYIDAGTDVCYKLSAAKGRYSSATCGSEWGKGISNGESTTLYQSIIDQSDHSSETRFWVYQESTGISSDCRYYDSNTGRLETMSSTSCWQTSYYFICEFEDGIEIPQGTELCPGSGIVEHEGTCYTIVFFTTSNYISGASLFTTLCQSDDFFGEPVAYGDTDALANALDLIGLSPTKYSVDSSDLPDGDCRIFNQEETSISTVACNTVTRVLCERTPYTGPLIQCPHPDYVYDADAHVCYLGTRGESIWARSFKCSNYDGDLIESQDTVLLQHIVGLLGRAGEAFYVDRVSIYIYIYDDAAGTIARAGPFDDGLGAICVGVANDLPATVPAVPTTTTTTPATTTTAATTTQVPTTPATTTAATTTQAPTTSQPPTTTATTMAPTTSQPPTTTATTIITTTSQPATTTVTTLVPTTSQPATTTTTTIATESVTVTTTDTTGSTGITGGTGTTGRTGTTRATGTTEGIGTTDTSGESGSPEEPFRCGHFSMNQRSDNFSVHLLRTLHQLSLIRCASQCTRLLTCEAFVYEFGAKRCFLVGASAGPSDTSTINGADLLYFKLDKT